MPLLESVPNISEGRDAKVVEEIGAAFGRRGTLLDTHSDVDHHRSVFTLVADADEIVVALADGIVAALDRIDIRAHEGIHPRVGVVDVVPIVPLAAGQMDIAIERARALAAYVGSELELPVFLYGASGDGRRPAFFRRGGPAELQRRVDAGELRPAFGPRRLHPTRGAVLIGARPLLVAFNVELARGDLDDAIAIATAIRESSGGMRGVQALGLLLPTTGRPQVSLNVIDVEAAPLAAVVERIRTVAAMRGVDLGPGELVGLLPECVVAPPNALGLAVLPDDRVLERAIASTRAR